MKTRHLALAVLAIDVSAELTVSVRIDCTFEALAVIAVIGVVRYG